MISRYAVIEIETIEYRQSANLNSLRD